MEKYACACFLYIDDGLVGKEWKKKVIQKRRCRMEGEIEKRKQAGRKEA